MTDTPHLSFEQVTIFGNAKGEIQVPNQGIAITFNSTRRAEPNVINICNGPYAKSDKSFVVSNSPDNEWLEQQLDTVAKQIEPQIGCWPSTGLVTVILMSLLSKQVNVQRMALLPSLARDEGMPKEQHLLCVVHNWLGERRIALGLVLTNKHIQWPELFLSPLVTSEDNEKAQALDEQNLEIANPFELLHKISRKAETPAAMIYTFQTSIFKQLAQMSDHIWLTMASTKALTQVEAIFAHEQAETESSPWYLTDPKVNQYLNPIRHHLAYCQQLIAVASIQGK
ncbi:hypothetical protein G3R49_07745 [Shewanella sp. WXL01]|uniref:hypothetical protein n=1 Tax=Shewanella sp. WXL01 TaxID=2709721 RepID=UPI0014385C75|nr:hypothetical protein [Shewanella sp. WXL01]NKF50462.1 hypothetical protein [Shewanella sp. WXL01]